MSSLGSANQIKIRSLWPLLVPLLLLLPGIAGFSFPAALSPYASISDLSISHYPNAVFLRQSILRYGQLPLWSPTILSGYPFGANPLSGLWYPPGWLALLLPLPLGFNVVVILHLLFGGLGMYLLVRVLGKGHPAAIFAAIAFEAMPKLFADYGAGHLTMIYAITLTPWFLLAEIRSRNDSGNFWLRQPGIVLGLIALADPRWAVYAGLAWIALTLVSNLDRWMNKLTHLLKQAVIAVAVAAPLLLPLFEYSQLSTRAQMTPADILVFSLPAAGLLGLLGPQYCGFHEWIIYSGITVLGLALLQVLRNKNQKMDWIWICIITIGLLFSLGENIPRLSLFTHLPGFSMLRVPPRILPLVGLALIVLAAFALDDVLSNKMNKPTWRRARLAFVAIIGLQAGLGLATFVLTNQISATYILAVGFSLAFLLIIFLFLRKLITAQWFWVLLLTLTLIDLGAMDASLFTSRNKETVLAEGSRAAAFLAQQPGQFRVYSPSYSIPQQTAAEYGLELADGVDPLQLRSYADFMQSATGVENNGYSVTLPAFTNNPAKDNERAEPDLNKLALLNVGYIASEFDMNIQGLDLVEKFGDTNVYRLAQTYPRAYIENDPEKEVRIERWSPNRIEITAQGPGRLVLSELMYPGWVAIVDGRYRNIETFHEVFRSVDLGEGSHHIIFEFRPVTVFVGLAICIISILVLIFSSVQRKRRT